jgi:hypothetical protein
MQLTFRAVLSGICFTFFVAVLRGGSVQDLHSATTNHGGFGLPDQNGSRLLVMAGQDRSTVNPVSLTHAELLKTALCGVAGRIPVQFERRQIDTATDGRATSSNFDTLAGSVFRVLRNKVDPGVPCFLASEALLAGSTVLSIAEPQGPGACLQVDRFTRLPDRRVARCWPIARLAAAKQVLLLEFERRGKDALASLVMVDGTRTRFADFTAEFRGPGEDLWRVDDGGVLSPEGITIVCALQRGSWYALGTAWAGAEGRSLSLWISDGSEQFTKVIDDYWYQAPR